MSAARLAKAAIKIPRRIERGPTDILKALASTVKHIPGQPETTLQDDPYLLPIRFNDRRAYILSKLSGKKTAKFLLNKHPELFYRDDAEPKIEAFHPPEEFRPDMDFTEDDVKWCIDNNDSPNGVIAYNALMEKGVKLTDETLLQFFEMICYTNEESLLDFNELETSHLQPDPEQQLVNQTWKTTGLAHKIFTQIKDILEPPRVYSAMIAGLCKYNEHNTAKQLFDEFNANHPNTGLYQVAYDGLLKSVPRLNSSVATAHHAVDEIVKHMEANLVMPNLHIFNSILKCYRGFNIDEATCVKSLSLINDMKSLNILPSLATYANLIFILCKYRGGQVYGHLVSSIVSHIELDAESLIIRDDRDAEFLTTIMSSVANYMHNLKLAHKVHSIYLKQPNLFANQRLRNKYLNDYFKLIVTTDTLENVLEFYYTYVPMHFQPSSDSYEALGEILELYQADEVTIKKIGKDLIEFRMAQYVKNDAIFRKDPSYVEALEKSI